MAAYWNFSESLEYTRIASWNVRHEFFFLVATKICMLYGVWIIASGLLLRFHCVLVASITAPCYFRKKSPIVMPVVSRVEHFQLPIGQLHVVRFRNGCRRGGHIWDAQNVRRRSCSCGKSMESNMLKIAIVEQSERSSLFSIFTKLNGLLLPMRLLEIWRKFADLSVRQTTSNLRLQRENFKKSPNYWTFVE